ncbi:hypothetical protein Naga_101942g1 [Nannochloropsis gaditana]|uniref:Uncharacterized protein n=1 Tax=Nannochloropsis gaditana TaxID=72520 RepID=W7T8T8_9STRA|nr:hypothetical protein Naga_101942g1 [Nannochloropsis gaditana]
MFPCCHVLQLSEAAFHPDLPELFGGGTRLQTPPHSASSTGAVSAPEEAGPLPVHRHVRRPHQTEAFPTQARESFLPQGWDPPFP